MRTVGYKANGYVLVLRWDLQLEGRQDGDASRDVRVLCGRSLKRYIHKSDHHKGRKASRMTLRGGVDQNLHRALAVSGDKVEVAVVVEIADCECAERAIHVEGLGD